jgi:Do/DeqQ family serine protease
MKSKLKYVTAAAAVVIVAGILFLFAPAIGFPQARDAGPTQNGVPVAATPANGGLASLQGSLQAVAKTVLPTVVEINVTETVTQKVPQSIFPFLPFFGQQQPQGNGGTQTFQQRALGSGIIVRHIGNIYYVLTNNHVVHGATDVSVRLSNQQVFKAKVVGTDPRKDIALVSFESGENLPIAVLGNSNDVQVGDIVLAVGNPLGFESSVTMGIVSALGRHGPAGDVAAYTDYIQTDAAINQGNSGGALVNINGQVIGINTWIAAPSGGNVGLGFAIPITNAAPEIAQFIQHGHVEYGWLGAQIADIQNSPVYENFASDLKVQGVDGSLLTNTYKNSPAAKAGLLPGDYVTKVDGTAIRNSNDLVMTVGAMVPGKSYDFTVIRDGRTVNVPVTIGMLDPNGNVASGKTLWPGMTVVDITGQVRQQANIPAALHGVVVGDLPAQDTPAAIAGFRPGDVITSIDGHHVSNILDYFKALNDSKGNQVTFNIVREGTDVSIGLSR